MSGFKERSITVFIASSRTGREIVQQGLERGYTVRAVIRSGSEAKFSSAISTSTTNHSNLTTYVCNPDSVSDITPAISGSDVVFIATGGIEIIKTAYYNQNLVTSILASLDTIEISNRPQRLVLLSAERVNPVFKDKEPWTHWLVTEKIMRPVFEDLKQAESILRKNQQKISYTFIQPGTIVEAPKTDSKIDLVDYTNNALISYPDLALSMLDAGFDKSCSNQRKGPVSQGETRMTWAGSRTIRTLLAQILKTWVLKPAFRVVLLVGAGYLLKSKVFVDKTLNVCGHKF